MSSSVEERPLLGGDEDDEDSLNTLVKTPSSEFRQLFSRQRNRNNGHGETLSASDIRISTSAASLSLFQDDLIDNLVAVFVVMFDTRSGNLVEWSIPEDIDLDSVEFKAMPSGGHTIESDFIYFRKGHYYGLSCFEKMAVASTLERGVRMKSVGVLSSSYTALHRHMDFLAEQVRKQLESPGEYDDLSEYFEYKKAVIEPRSTSEIDIDSAINFEPSTGIIKSSSIPTMQITHPAGCFSQFFRFFGKSIFALWRAVLLQKRVLFFSPPPVGVICYRVYCASCLGRHNSTSHVKNSKPYFYVNIADIDALESELHYIACTTEKIFEEKDILHDIYVDQQNIKTSDAQLKEIIKLNKRDDEKYHQLINSRQEYLYMKQFGEAEYESEEQMFIGFFANLNNRIFQIFDDVLNSDQQLLTNEHMLAMSLDPHYDRTFIIKLLELHNINITLIADNSCCPV